MGFVLKLVTWWNGQTFGTQLFTWRNGKSVGTDAEGNLYYQTVDGKRRWVIFNGETEASRVSPEWHGWLHHTWDEPPTALALPRKVWEKPHLPNLTGTARAFAPQGSIRRAQPETPSDYEAWTPK